MGELDPAVELIGDAIERVLSLARAAGLGEDAARAAARNLLLVAAQAL